MMDYTPPALLRGGHLQSILPARLSAAPSPQFMRERWELDDGDFIDADWLHPRTIEDKSSTKLLVLFHGLEGSSQSHYGRSIGAHFQQLGWRVVIPNFRGCSGEPNRLLRAYHSGDGDEIGRLLSRVHQQYPNSPLYAAGVSLGGNALLCYLSQANSNIPLISAAAVCAPLDLGRCGEAITQGFSNVYTSIFMSTLRAKSIEKRTRFPKGCDWDAVLAAKNLAQFDDAFTAPVHGYLNTADFYARASAKPKLRTITLKTLLLNALNDPFVPQDIVENLVLSPSITQHLTAQGGHVGYAEGSGYGQLTWLPRRLEQWFTQGV